MKKIFIAVISIALLTLTPAARAGGFHCGGGGFGIGLGFGGCGFGVGVGFGGCGLGISLGLGCSGGYGGYWGYPAYCGYAPAYYAAPVYYSPPAYVVPAYTYATAPVAPAYAAPVYASQPYAVPAYTTRVVYVTRSYSSPVTASAAVPTPAPVYVNASRAPIQAYAGNQSRTVTTSANYASTATPRAWTPGPVRETGLTHFWSAPQNTPVYQAAVPQSTTAQYVVANR